MEQHDQRGCSLGDVGALLLSGDGLDVTLVVGGAQLPAHRSVLSARSPVLANILHRNPKETHIQIPDMEEDVALQLLVFMYTDRTPQLKTYASKLLVAADKYNLPDLLQRCEAQMVRDLRVENAAEAAVLAMTHGCSKLKAAAVAFIRAHNEVMGTSGWERAMQSHRRVVAEICRLVAATPERGEAQRSSRLLPLLCIFLAIVMLLLNSGSKYPKPEPDGTVWDLLKSCKFGDR